MTAPTPRLASLTELIELADAVSGYQSAKRARDLAQQHMDEFRAHIEERTGTPFVDEPPPPDAVVILHVAAHGSLDDGAEPASLIGHMRAWLRKNPTTSVNANDLTEHLVNAGVEAKSESVRTLLNRLVRDEPEVVERVGPKGSGLYQLTATERERLERERLERERTGAAMAH